MQFNSKSSQRSTNSNSTYQHSTQKVLSKRIVEYKQFFSATRQFDMTQKQVNLQTANIYYNANVFQEHLNITILDKTQCNQIIKMSVCFAYFLFQIKLLNVLQKSQSNNNLKLLSQGSYGKVFQVFINRNSHFAIKSIPYSSKVQKTKTKELTKSLRNSIFQYCLCKLFSILEIGPSVKSHAGFDLVIFHDTVEFCMEVCEKSRFDSINNLKQSLRTMHSFNIIHGDIKPENIMWSPQFQKNVFIDFGLSLFLKEKYGENTYTSFFGTYYYCCEQMKQLMNRNVFGYIDLYYNDIYSLQKISQNKVQKKCKFKTVNNKFILTNQFTNIYQNYLLMSFIYSRDQKQVKLFISEQNKFSFIQNTIDLLKYTEYDKRIGQIFSELQNSYSFPSEEQKAIEKSHHQKFCNYESIDQQKFKKLENRIGQTFSEFKGIVNDMMLFFFIFYKEDITPFSLNKKLLLKNKILKHELDEPSYWNDLIEFIQNPYLNTEEVFEIFEHLKCKLQIKDWEKNPINEFQLYSRSFQITVMVMKKYSVDLSCLNEKITQDTSQQRLSSETEQFLFQIYPQMSEIVKKIHQFKQKAKKNYRIVDKQKLLSQLKAHSPLKQQGFMKFIFEAIDLELSGQTSISFEDIGKFVDNFRNEKMGKKTRAITTYRFYQLQRQKYNYHKKQFMNMEKAFYQRQTKFLFSLFHQIKILLFPIPQLLAQPICYSYQQIKTRVLKVMNLGQSLKRSEVLLEITQLLCPLIKEINEKNTNNNYDALIRYLQSSIKNIIKYYDYSTEYCFSSLFSIIKCIFQKTQQNKLFILQVFSKLNQSGKKFRLFENAVLISFVLLSHNIKSLKQIIQLLQTHIQQHQPKFEQSFHQKQNTIYFYTNYIFFVNKFGADLSKQVQYLAQLLLTHPEQCFVSCFCVALYFSWKKNSFSDYISFLQRYLQKILLNRKNDRGRNFEQFYECYIIVETYFSKKNDKLKVIKEFFDHINTLYYTHPEDFCSRNSNFIIAIQLLIKYAINYDIQFIFKCFYFSSFLINKCNPYFTTHFRKEMIYFDLLLVQKGVFRVSKRKRKLKYLKMIRSSHLSFTPFEFIHNIWKQNNFERAIKNKILLMCNNRIQKPNLKEVNLKQMRGIFSAYSCMDNPFSFPLEEQQKLMSNMHDFDDLQSNHFYCSIQKLIVDKQNYEFYNQSLTFFRVFTIKHRFIFPMSNNSATDDSFRHNCESLFYGFILLDWCRYRLRFFF